jgi:hypothetical protein
MAGSNAPGFAFAVYLAEKLASERGPEAVAEWYPRVAYRDFLQAALLAAGRTDPETELRKGAAVALAILPQRWDGVAAIATRLASAETDGTPRHGLWPEVPAAVLAGEELAALLDGRDTDTVAPANALARIGPPDTGARGLDLSEVVRLGRRRPSSRTHSRAVRSDVT